MKALALLLSSAAALTSLNAYSTEPEQPRSPYKIIAEAGPKSWRPIDASNSLLIELEAGNVLVELAPEFAPGHVKNMKALAREGFYQGLSIYRFVEGFVAQGGDKSEKKAIKTGQKEIKSERYTKGELDFSPLGFRDLFAQETGFVRGFPAARNTQGESWMVHCPGVFAMARNEPIDSGGTEFYIVLGHAPRYLDRNVTVFGRVVDGMAHIQSLQRQETEGKAFNTIKSVQVLSDLEQSEYHNRQIMRTNSKDFAELIRSRANRPESWFVEQANYVDVCGVPVPSRIHPEK